MLMNQKKTGTDLDEPWTTSWNEEDLEAVDICPVCKNQQRKILHNGLVDNVFRVAPGYWNLYECLNCASAYLDPRPTQQSIGSAYQTYYTHNASGEREESSQLGRLRLLRRALANGYANDRYGSQYQPASRFGAVFAGIFPAQREVLDVKFRWLPKPELGQRLLDVGCGNGKFLLNARDAGWQVVGVDPDPNAVATAQALGLEVHKGSIEILDCELASFDAITLSHVIEHVHEPGVLLSSVQRLLKPGGILYIDTPNIHSLGAKTFGPNWRGIESPRHLVLFSINGLQLLLKQCGFVNVELKPRRNVTKNMFLSSFKLLQGLSPYSVEPRSLPFSMLLRTHFPLLSVSDYEYITLLARKGLS